MTRPRRSVPRLAMPALLIAIGVGGFARAARAEIFADVPGIPGESISPLAPGQIDVRSIQFGSGRAVSALAKQKASSACVAKTGAQIGQVVITKGTDKASPKLFMAAAAGTRFPTVTITFFKDSPSGPTQYLKIKLTDALIDSISSSGSSSDTPTESVSLSFASMETTYSKIGNPDEAATAAFCVQ